MASNQISKSNLTIIRIWQQFKLENKVDKKGR